jgi:hypothetical protein
MPGVTRFENMYCSGEIKEGKNNDIVIRGRVQELLQDNSIYYIAASPPDYRATYTGSGLPFANETQAFDNTPNLGKAYVNNGVFEFSIMYPNSYMRGLGSIQIPPTVFFEYKNMAGETKSFSVKISEGLPYRSLTYPYENCPRKDATFYSVHHCLPIRKNQEAILRDSQYPSTNIMPKNHWGLKPAL